MMTQGCALHVHRCPTGLSHWVLSSVPDFTLTRRWREIGTRALFKDLEEVERIG
jgi:hypothetical protein